MVNLVIISLIFSIYGLNPSNLQYILCIRLCSRQLMKSLLQMVKLVIISLISFMVLTLDHIQYKPYELLQQTTLDSAVAKEEISHNELNFFHLRFLLFPTYSL